MKRIIASVLLAALAFEAGAQSFQDAIDFAGNDYLGSARSVGMGNAVTAVGGDLGSLTFNPAGSAVAGYSQFTITPGLSVSSVFGQGTLWDGKPFGFEDAVKTRSPRMNLPNLGAVVVYDTRNKTGLKRVSFGVVGNITRDFNNKLRASGTNDNSTLAGALATWANGYTQDELTNGEADWETEVAWRSEIFNPIPGKTDRYIGITERLRDDGLAQLADKIGQTYQLKRSGRKYDLLMNVGLDFSDRFYVGANLGISTITYRYDEIRGENALPGGDYPTGFQNLRMQSSFEDEASGIYAKVGFIARPTDGLRIGAAIQTPTLFEFNEVYGQEGSSLCTGDEKPLRSSESEEWYYNFRTPLRVNAGIAYTIGKVALLSADYEYFDYSKVRYQRTYDDSYTDFTRVNEELADYGQPVHAFRVGGELKASPELAIRVGYNYATSPDVEVESSRQAVSFGLGYSSPGSFFADLAVRFQYLPDELITPYSYPEIEKIVTPEICSQASLCNALLTLGWRF
jgi:long-subunit fatty acid transport protein